MLERITVAIRKVAVMGNPILRTPALSVSENEIRSPKIQTLIQDMIETMFEYDGRGLAAPQVHERLQILVMLWDFEETEKTKVVCLINPEIKALTSDTSSYWEGCLSLPGLRGLVSRPNKISVRALNERAERTSFMADGFCATVIQHECDHLAGKLYIDHIKDFTQLAFEREYRRYLASNQNQEDAAEV